jgi:hypothetical protein
MVMFTLMIMCLLIRCCSAADDDDDDGPSRSMGLTLLIEAPTRYVDLLELDARVHWRQLGRGHFGAVYAAKRNGNPVCIKSFHAEPVAELQRQLYLRIHMQVNEFALVHELGPDAVGRLSNRCVFATGFAIDQMEDGSNCMLVLLPLLSGASKMREFCLMLRVKVASLHTPIVRRLTA